jgi:diguanylate cyclase (GGDEF)-like protein/PAS domain S-box-containing protein
MPTKISQVLIAADNNNAADILLPFLKSGSSTISQYNVHQIAGYEATLAALQSNNFDLYLINETLEQQDTLQLLRSLRQKQTLPPIWVLVSDEVPEFTASALLVGALGCLVKAELDESALLQTTRIAHEYTRLSLEAPGERSHPTDVRVDSSDSAQLVHAIRQTKSGLVVTDALQSHDPIIFTDTGFCEISGYSPGEVLGSTNCILLQIDDTSVDITHIESLLKQGETYSNVFDARRKDGSRFWDQMTIFPVFDENKRLTYYAISHSDVTEQRTTEAKLAESEELFRSLIENSLDITAVISANEKLLYVSDSVKDILGYEPEKLLGCSVLQYVHPEDREVLKRIISDAVSGVGRTKRTEFRMRRSDGLWRTIEAMGRCLGEGNRSSIVINARDMTERREVEQALRESRSWLATVINNMPVIIWAVDRNGIITFSDGKALESLGLSAGINVGQSIFTLYGKIPVIVDATRRALQGETVRFECHIGKSVFNSCYVPIFDENGERAGAIGCSNEITAEWHSQRSLRFQASVLDAVGQAAIAVDRDSRIVYWNRTAHEMLGWSADEALGQNLQDIVAVQAAPEAIKDIVDNVLSGERWSGEVCIQHRDGNQFPALMFKSPIVDEHGSIIGISAICQDITERKATEEALRTSEERYALAAEGSNAGLWDWDLKTNSIYFSARWKAMVGSDVEQIADSPDEWFIRIHPDETERVRAELESHLKNDIPHFESEYRILHADGTYHWMIARGIALRDVQGLPYRVAGSQTDITERKSAEEKLLKNAFFDNLTGLPNRILFLDRLERMINSAKRRKDYAFALLFLDLDRFKVVNDSLGHTIGDKLLVEVTQRLELCVRANDTFARLGGDEFAILLDDIRDVGDATNLAERLQSQLSTPLALEGHEIFPSVSIGIALSAGDGTDEKPEDLLRDADTAMYRAKSQGKARYEVFDSAMHAHAFALLKTEAELRRALEREELETHYQPIVSLRTGKLAAFEALVRWNHPERGLIGPAEFIPVAEDSGLVVPLGEWILHNVCRQIRTWHNERAFPNGEIPTFAVNISSRQFSEPRLVEVISHILGEHEIDPSWIKLEITESVIMENSASAAIMLHELKQLGFQLSIDDFGTGYSSLSSLHQFPLDTLKIDRTFVQRLGEQGENSEIVRTIIALASNLGMSVVAEGIEAAGQLAQLRALQCDYGQGYFFARPMPADAAQTMLASGPYWWQNH